MSTRERPLRVYMVYDREAGSEEGAVLAFAYTAKEARRIAGPTLSGYSGAGYIDIAARWMPNCTHTPVRPEPHVIEPDVCQDCDLWHDESLDENGRCEGCADEAEWQQEEETTAASHMCKKIVGNNEGWCGHEAGHAGECGAVFPAAKRLP